MKTPLGVKLVYLASAAMLIVYFILAWLAPSTEKSLMYDCIQYSCLGAAIFIMTFITIFNYVRGGYLFRSYEFMVKKRLDEYLEKLNKKTYHNRGLEWYVVPDHYWMELRILAHRNINPNPNRSKPQLFSPTSSVLEKKATFSQGSHKVPLPQFSEENKKNDRELVKHKHDVADKVKLIP